MLLVLFLESPLLHESRTIVSSDFLEAGRLKAKYHSDRHILQQYRQHSNSPMVNSLKERFANIRMKIAIVRLQQNCEKKSD